MSRARWLNPPTPDQRDAYVIDTCVQREIPIVMTTGGGYSRNAWKVQHASIRNLLKKYGVVRDATDESARLEEERASPPEKE